MRTGVPGWLGWLSVDFGLGHDLVVCGLESHVGLCADSSEPGASFGFCVSVSLSVPPLLILGRALSLSKINKHKKITNGIYVWL